MATSFRIPLFLPISPSHCRKPFFFYHHREQQLCASEWSLRKRNRSICFACAVKLTRVRRKVKSNEELRGEIMEFIALVGFPEDHVPSIKELSDHGRNDLANIVRRRGYKFIRELLANSKMENNKEFASDETANFGPSAAGVSEKDALTGQDERAQGKGEEDLSSRGFSSMGGRYSAAPDNSMYLDRHTNNSREGNFITFLSPRAEGHGSAGKDGSPVVEVPGIQNSLPVFGNGIYLSLDDKSDSGDLESDRMEINEVVGDDLSSSEFPTLWNVSYVLDDTPNCSDKEADNVVAAKYEDVNNVGKDASLSSGVHPYEQHYTSPVLNYRGHADVNVGTSFTLHPDDVISDEGICQNQLMDGVANYRLGGLDHRLVESDDKDRLLGLSSVTSSIEEKIISFIQYGLLDAVDDNKDDIPNGSPQKEYTGTHDPENIWLTTTSSEHVRYSCRNQRNASMTSNGNAIDIEEITHAATVDSSDRNIGWGNENSDQHKDLHEETGKRENLVEIECLKFMLHEKELKLSTLKEQIEKEKQALSDFQRKAETEINKAQKLISEKDAELQAAEDSLLGLQEVEIEYCGDGHVVEVTGSFNGWLNHVEMELQPSKSTGKLKCWSTLLWLYPGKYEIKFIVNGKWMIDPRKEVISKGNFTNNFIKVDI